MSQDEKDCCNPEKWIQNCVNTPNPNGENCRNICRKALDVNNRGNNEWTRQ